ncbi:hypothetical protein D1BOALGB6SA_394 [Olavius sp. associated proteobacterium Delta 1]|nr:hypothetical protein D1BOALGB6SA_394 [Olavius sp. associated proteobacterium Delta 1]
MKIRKRLFAAHIPAIVLAVLFIACQESKAPVEKSTQEVKVPELTEEIKTPDSTEQKVVLEGDDVVLARVAGEPITRYDLAQTIRSMLGEQSAVKLDEAGRQKVLESLVASRAIARVRAASLSLEDRAVLDKKVRSYQEQLLVKQYLARHASPQPVTREMVSDYYQAHPERFGGRTIRSYEILASKQKLKTEARDSLIAVFKAAAGKEDWKQWAQQLQAEGYPIEFRQGRVEEKLLHPPLQQLMKPLKKTETSKLSFIEGRAYLVRIVDERQIAPRPLHEVSAEIRRALVPIQLKKAVKQASRQVLETTEVMYEEH